MYLVFQDIKTTAALSYAHLSNLSCLSLSTFVKASPLFSLIQRFLLTLIHRHYPRAISKLQQELPINIGMSNKLLPSGLIFLLLPLLFTPILTFPSPLQALLIPHPSCTTSSSSSNEAPRVESYRNKTSHFASLKYALIEPGSTSRASYRSDIHCLAWPPRRRRVLA